MSRRSTKQRRAARWRRFIERSQFPIGEEWQIWNGAVIAAGVTQDRMYREGWRAKPYADVWGRTTSFLLPRSEFFWRREAP